jgi:hypothetical protein
MPTYRAFEVDDGGHVSAPAKIIEARSDLQAIARRVGIIEKREDE